MGKLGDFIKDLFGSGYNNIFQGKLNGHDISSTSYGQAVESWLNGATGAGLTPAEQAANEFSHNEAQLARDWQENFYNQYQSPQAMVRQYQEAGLNPALMYGSGASSPGVVSSSAPSSVTPSSSPMAMMQLIPGLARLKSEIENVHADTMLKRDQSRYQRALSNIEEIRGLTEAPLRALELQLKEQGVSLNDLELAWKPEQYEQAYRRGEIDIEAARVGIAQALLECNQLRADTALTREKLNTEKTIQALNAAQKVLADKQGKYISAQTVEQEWRNQIERDTNAEPGTNIWGLIPSLVEGVKQNIRLVRGKFEHNHVRRAPYEVPGLGR